MKSEDRYGYDYNDDDIPEIDLPKSDRVNTDFPEEYGNKAPKEADANKEMK